MSAQGVVRVNSPRQVLFASLIGTTIEFFDFYIYGTAAVLVFPVLFFPASDPATATLASLGVRAGVPLVVMVGALVGHKDPLTFVHAMAAVHGRLPEAQALLVGSGPLFEALEAEVLGSGLEGVVLLAGQRTDADELLAAASVAVLSSKAEGLGTVVLDAMQLGVPVVATATPAIREVVRDGVDGFLVPVGDAASLADRIVHVLVGGEKGRLVASARERARAFSAEATAAGTLSVYRALTG